MSRKSVVTFLLFLIGQTVYALEPNQILVIANSESPSSMEIAQYYCTKRAVPADNILALPLGIGLSDTISRSHYERLLVEPIRKRLYSRKFAGKIRCLLTTYGVPFKVGQRGPLEGQLEKLARLKKQRQQIIQEFEDLKLGGFPETSSQIKGTKKKLAQLQSLIDHIEGKETNASVDSELSMLLFGDYELYRWQPNKLKYKMSYWDFKSLMVCRLDGPEFEIVRGLVDKAITAEKTGLKGVAYIDSGHSKNKPQPIFVRYDQSLHNMALMIKTETQIPVVEEQTSALFAPGQCPSAILYCGWYSLRNYVDAFDFVDGAIGYHIASWEAEDLRNSDSTRWCPAMLRDGITATLGATYEPYLQAFPKPVEFFAELLDGRCLVEAYYRTKPFNSWQLVLIGDPLYRPFKIPSVVSSHKIPAK